MTVREVMNHYHISFVTAQRSLASLAQQGLVLSQRGRGTVVLRKGAAAARGAKPSAATATRRVLILWPTRQPVSSVFQAQISPIVDGLRAALPGYALSLEFADELLLEESGQDYLDHLVATPGSSAFCLISAPSYVKKYFESRRRPVVVLGSVEPGIRLSSVSSNEEKAIHDLTWHLATLGHTRIAHVVGAPRVAGHESRLRGYRRAMAQISGPTQVEWELTVPGDSERASAQFSRLLSGRKAPTAVICTGPTLAGWVRSAAGDRVHVAWDVHSDAHGPPIPASTLLVWPGEEFGYQAGLILQEQMQGPAGVREHIVDYVAIRDQ